MVRPRVTALPAGRVRGFAAAGRRADHQSAAAQSAILDRHAHRLPDPLQQLPGDLLPGWHGHHHAVHQSDRDGGSVSVHPKGRRGPAPGADHLCHRHRRGLLRAQGSIAVDRYRAFSLGRTRRRLRHLRLQPDLRLRPLGQRLSVAETPDLRPLRRQPRCLRRRALLRSALLPVGGPPGHRCRRPPGRRCGGGLGRAAIRPLPGRLRGPAGAGRPGLAGRRAVRRCPAGVLRGHGTGVRRDWAVL